MSERVAPTVEQLCGIIYDALKDQFPSQGAAIIIASCCAEPIHRRLAACARERDRSNREYYKEVLNKAGEGQATWVIHEAPILSEAERAVGEKPNV